MIGEVFRATMIGEMNDHTAVVFDFGYADTGISGSAGHVDTGTAAGDFQTAVQAIMVGALPLSYTARKYRFSCVLGTHIGEIGYVSVEPGVAGSLSTDNMKPFEISIPIRRSTGHASRRDRGRIFLGPVSEDHCDATKPNGPDLPSVLLTNVANLLKANLTAAGIVLKPVIVAADGTYSGNVINQASVGSVFVHRKSRRPRILA